MKVLVSAATLGAVAIGFLACEATIEASGKVNSKEINVKVGVSPAGTATIQETPDDARVDLEFRDANGNVVGSITGAAVGDSFAIPAGTAAGTFSGPSSATTCSGCLPSGGGGRSNATHTTGYKEMQPTLNGFAGKYFIAVMPLAAFTDPSAPGFGPLANKSAGFIVQSDRPLTLEQRFNRIRTYLFAEPLAAPNVAAGVQIEYLTLMEPNSFGQGSRLWTYDVTEDWFLYDALWNGDLLEYTTHLPGNGWTVQESSIPLSSFNTHGVNQLVLTSQTAEDQEPITLDYGALSN